MSDTKLADLIQQGVTTVRLSYSDLHGIARGKEFPASYFEHLSDFGALYVRLGETGRIHVVLGAFAARMLRQPATNDV